MLRGSHFISFLSLLVVVIGGVAGFGLYLDRDKENSEIPGLLKEVLIAAISAGAGAVGGVALSGNGDRRSSEPPASQPYTFEDSDQV